MQSHSSSSTTHEHQFIDVYANQNQAPVSSSSSSFVSHQNEPNLLAPKNASQFQGATPIATSTNEYYSQYSCQHDTWPRYMGFSKNSKICVSLENLFKKKLF